LLKKEVLLKVDKNKEIVFKAFDLIEFKDVEETIIKDRGIQNIDFIDVA
jgi:hypothetical protein